MPRPGKPLSDSSLRALHLIAASDGKFRTAMKRTHSPGKGQGLIVNLHTAWALEERGLVRLRDAYIETSGWLTPFAKQLLPEPVVF